MLATSVRVRPWRARSSPRSVGRVTTSSPSRCSIFMRAGTCCVSAPSGPFTITRPGSIDTETLDGTSMGFLPIRLMRLPDEADDLAADPLLLGGAARDEAGGRGHDRRAHSAQDARQTILARIDPAAGLGDPLEPRDHALAVAPELELDDQGIEGVIRPPFDAVVVDVAFLLEQARDLDLLPRGRHR